MATHISEEDILKLAPLHVNLIHDTGIKRKEDKGKIEWSPTPAQLKKKKARKNKQNQLEKSGDVTLGNITKNGKPAATLEEVIDRD